MWTKPAPVTRRALDHASLQFGEFAKGGLDALLDGANLGGDFISGIFDHLFAHDCSFPGAGAGAAVGLIWCRCASS